MTTVVSNSFKVFNADNFINSFSNNSYYLFTGFPIPYDDDNIPPTIGDCPKDVNLDVHDYMISGKRLSATDVVKMINRYDWVSGEVYDQYTHDNSSLNDARFYVLVNEGASYSVFKCLSNNNGAPSTSSPTISGTSTNNDIYSTVDGYQWKFMYQITGANYTKFATDDYIPVYANNDVSTNANNGSIDFISVVSAGSNYASYTNGTFQAVFVNSNTLNFKIESAASSNNNFYKDSAFKIISGTGSGEQKKITAYDGPNRVITIDSEFTDTPTTAYTYEISPLVTIVGDGSGALARAVVNASTNSISSIEINEQGSGYTYASASVTGNTGVIGISSAEVKVIISPQGGHGSNAELELGAKYLGISTTFDSSVSVNKIINENDFRSIGVIQNPLFSNVVINISSATGTFVPGEAVVLYESDPIADVVITNPGSGYTTNATITVVNGTTGGTGLSANAEANTTGKIELINVVAHGSGYLFNPTATVAAPANLSFNSNSAVSSADEFITVSGHKFQNNDYITYFTATGNTAVSGLTSTNQYYVVQSNSTGVKLSLTVGGSPINLTNGLTETGHFLRGNTATVLPVINFTNTAIATGTVVTASASQVKLTNVNGLFVQDVYIYGKTSGHRAFANSITQPSTYFDTTTKILGTLSSGTFIEDEVVSQVLSEASGRVYFANSTVLRLVNVEGSFNSSNLITGQTSSAQWTPAANSTTVTSSDIVKDNGNVLYVENFTPISKTANQTETFKLVFGF